MSFSSEQKKGVTETAVKNACCRRAILAGILAAKAEHDGQTVSLRLAPEVMPYADHLISEVYSVVPSSVTSASGGRGRMIGFSSKSASSYLQMLEEEEIRIPAKCSSCQAAFLRGVFLACGRISNPEKSFCLEFSFGNRIEAFFSLYEDLGLAPKKVARGSENILYFKNSSAIEDFFAVAQMPQTAFALLNESIASEIRNRVNRVANCETSNIQKAVKASVDTVQKLRKLDSLGLFSRIPEDLRETARLRMEEDSLSLAQLASRTTPPLTKSGVSHRLQKIDAIAEDLLTRFDSGSKRKD